MFFCQDKHWSDKWEVVTDPLSWKEFLKKSGKCFLCLKDNHQVKDCKKSKPCYYCKGLHNSAIYFQKDKKGDPPKLAEEIKQDLLKILTGVTCNLMFGLLPNSCRCC